eukprot:8148-Heterococcus_DN1.PRE.5
MYIKGPDTASDEVLEAVTANMLKVLREWQARLLALREGTAIFIEVPTRIVKRDTSMYLMFTRCRELDRCVLLSHVG